MLNWNFHGADSLKMKIVTYYEVRVAHLDFRSGGFDLLKFLMNNEGVFCKMNESFWNAIA